ncbi:MAG: zinc-ribbon domain-containing protein [Candidatus Magnetomorum sp.]|nr:zinc-ribbon domain-containing protein [Candidatus Magnetomorum sp.]
MKIICEKCHVVYHFDEQKINPDGSAFRCFNCRHIFTVTPEFYDPLSFKKTEPEASPQLKTASLPKKSSPEPLPAPTQSKSDTPETQAPFTKTRSIKLSLFSNIKGDFSGAISAAIITLPMSIGYGIIAFAPLGLQFAPQAALLGIYTAIFGAFIAAFLGGTPLQITGPKAPLTLILSAVIANLCIQLPTTIENREILIVGMGALCVGFAGFFQLLFGILRLGNLVKFVPFPVVSGFMNGIAILLIIKQIKPLMGMNIHTSLFTLFTKTNAFQPLTLIVGLTTLSVLFLSKRYNKIKIIPSSLMGLGSGTLLYYLLSLFASPEMMGPIVGNIDVKFPQPNIFPQLMAAAQQIDVWVYIPDILISGFVLGLLASMESLLSSVVSDNLTDSRHNSTQELVGQGLANISCACFGALPGAGSVPRSLASYNAGGRTRLSGMFCGLFIFVVIMSIGKLVGKIPMAAIAGIIISVGISLFDSWTMNLLKKLTAPKDQRRDALMNLMITLTVAAITVSINLIVAVGIGVAIASGLFMSKMGKSIIKRKYFGNQFHSKKMRSLSNSDLLEKEGNQIVIFELQGPLFFGSAENLSTQVEEAMNTARYCIVDMKRVTEIDSTGANILTQLKRSFEKEKKYLLFTYLKENKALWGFLEIMDISPQLKDLRFFSDTDAALEWSEDNLLSSLPQLTGTQNEVPLEDMDIVKGFTHDELEVLRQKLYLETYNDGEPIFREGDPGRDLFFLTKGSVSVKIRLRERNQLKRIFTFTSGVIFGEVALLDGKPRSADIWAEEKDTEVYRLSLDDFDVFRRERPEIAIKLIQNIARALTRHLRRSSDEVRALEDS